MPDEQLTPRQIADRYVERLAALDPLVATSVSYTHLTLPTNREV